MTKTRKMRVTLTLDVRDMTDDEFDEHGGHEMAGDPENPDFSAEGWVDELEPMDLAEAIQGALGSADNPEMFAGSGQFLVTENAVVVSAEWVD